MTQYVIGIRIPTDYTEIVQYYSHDDMLGKPLFTPVKESAPKFKKPNLANRIIYHLKNKHTADYFVELA